MNSLRIETQTIRKGGDRRLRVTLYGDDKVLYVDEINVDSSRSRRQFARAAAERAGLPAQVEEIEGLLIDAARDASERDAEPEPQPIALSSADLLATTPPDVLADATAMLNAPELIDLIGQDLGNVGLTGDRSIGWTLYVVGTSRLLKRPLNAIVCGATAAGKSHTVNTVARLFPGEAKILAHRITPKALYYMDDLRHKFVVGGERSRSQDDDTADATKALREMQSDGVLRCAVTENSDGKMTVTHYEKEGPIAYVESTSAASIFPEDENRCLICHIDESHEQTEAILLAAGDAATGLVPDVEPIVARHHALQRMLAPLPVHIPFGPLLAKRFPKRRLEVRRAFTHFLSTIRAIALLRQFQKTVRDGAIVADEDDYAAALGIIRPTLLRIQGQMDDAARRVLEAVQRHGGKDEVITRLAAATWAGIRESDAGPRLRVLADLDYLKELQPHRGNRPAKYRLNPNPPDASALALKELPPVEEVADSLRAGGGE